MKKLILLFVVLSLCPLWVPCVQAADSVAIFMWDGAGLNNVQPMLEQGRLPNLQKLLDSGACLLPLDSIHRTCTMAVWPQFVTGGTYDQTGSTGNYKSGGASGNVAPHPKYNTWDEVVPYNWTIPSLAKVNGYRDAWLVSKSFLTNKGPLACIYKNANVWLMRTAEGAGGSDNYLDELVQVATSFVTQPGPFLLYLHLDPDHYGHKFGEKGPRYLEEIERCDAALGLVMAALPPGTRIMVVSDHGFDIDGSTHYNAPDAFAVVYGFDIHPAYWLQAPQRARASHRDLATTLLAYFGADLKAWKIQIRGKDLTQ